MSKLLSVCGFTCAVHCPVSAAPLGIYREQFLCPAYVASIWGYAAATSQLLHDDDSGCKQLTFCSYGADIVLFSAYIWCICNAHVVILQDFEL